MTVNIKDNDYELYFGIGFVRKLDEKYYTNGVGKSQYGLGLAVIFSKLLDEDMVALSEIIYEATSGNKKRPSQADVDGFIDSIEDIDGFIEEVKSELKKSNACRKKLEQMEKVQGSQETESGS